MGGLPHTSPEVHLQNPPSTFPAIILSLFQPRQPRVHLIKTLKMPSFCFLAHFVQQTRGGGWNLRQQMVECDRSGWEPTATRSGKVGGNKIDTFGETTTHVELRQPKSGLDLCALLSSLATGVNLAW